MFDASTERTIAQRVADGERKQSLADELGVHRNTVANICSRFPDLFKSEGQVAA